LAVGAIETCASSYRIRSDRQTQGAAVGVQSAGHVERQQGGRAAAQPDQPLGHAALRRAHGADAQQGVDGQVVRPEFDRGLIGKPHPRVAGPLQRRARVRRQPCLLAQPGHHRAQAPVLQVHGRLQPVAPVVARAAGDPHGARVRCQCQRQPRRGQAGALHQGVRGQGGLRRRLDAPGGGQVEQRDGAIQRQQVRHGSLCVSRCQASAFERSAWLRWRLPNR
jgi:hypothetical protein